MTCIDLDATYGHRLRITWDEAAGASRSDPWLMQIPCSFGTIYPFGGDKLALEMDGHRLMNSKIMAIPGVRIHQDGDHEKTYVFHADQFESIAALVRPWKRTGGGSAEHLVPYHFKPVHRGTPGEPGDTISPKAD